MIIRIKRKIDVIKESRGHYYSFPTAALTLKGETLITYRDAEFHEDILPPDYAEHGIKGDIYLLSIDSKLQRVNAPDKIYNHEVTGSNEQNSILSGSGKDIYLFSRQYGGSNDVFFSWSSNGGITFSKREKVVLGEFEFMACYGRIREFKNRLIAPVYGVTSNPDPENCRCGSAWIYSEKKEFNWKFGGWISAPIPSGASFNETSILQLADGNFLAVLRSGEANQNLFFSFSKNGLNEWSYPEEIRFRGEAPELYNFGNGTIGLSYRGFGSDNTFSWSLRLSNDWGKTWEEPYCIDKYGGSRFHGGYGDIVPYVEKNNWLALFYSPGEFGFPGIKGAILEIEAR